MGSLALSERDTRASAARMDADRIGLITAVGLHVAVVALFFVNYSLFDSDVPAPERMTVSLASEVSLTSQGQQIVAESRASVAPEETTPADTPPNDSARPAEQVRAATPTPRETAPTPSPTRAASEAATAPPASTPKPSRIGDNFLAGGGSSSTTDETRLPASEIGSSAKASIIQAIGRQIKPHWNAPDGADAEKLVSILAFELNEDGSLKGRPRVINQSGINASNRPQAALHAERAVRAVQLAAPFDLPDEYYNAWKSIRGARFDRNLSR